VWYFLLFYYILELFRQCGIAWLSFIKQRIVLIFCWFFFFLWKMQFYFIMNLKIHCVIAERLILFLRFVPLYYSRMLETLWGRMFTRASYAETPIQTVVFFVFRLDFGTVQRVWYFLLFY
jgi:hypothetical protein